MYKLKLFLTKLFYPVALFWWPTWSKIYRRLYHRKYKDVILDICQSPQQAMEEMQKLKWAPDNSRALWDAIGDARWVQHCINTVDQTGKQPKGSLDCDEFAVWAAQCTHPRFDPKIFIYSWITRSGKLKGHAMCWVRTKDGRFFHIGNWGQYGPYRNLREACSVILTLGNGSETVGWAFYDKHLNLRDWGRELPSKNIW